MKLLWQKLIFKCFMVTLPLWLLWLFIWIAPNFCYPVSYIPNVWNKEFISSAHKENYDTVIIGDSMANSAFVPNYLSEYTVNLASNTNNPFTAYYILETYLKNNQTPKTCYIMFADHHMKSINGFYVLTLRIHHLTFAQEIELFRNAVLYNEGTIIRNNWQTDWLSSRLRLPHLYMLTFFKLGFLKYKHVLETLHLGEIHKGSFISRSLRESKCAEQEIWDKYEVKPLYDFYYKKILDLCNKKGIKVRIIIMPKGSWIYTTDNYMQTMRDYYHNLTSQYPNVAYIESTGEFKRYHFSDHHHLNMRGSLKFSREIKKMFPQDFADSGEKSSQTIEGMEDYLCFENTIADIVSRIVNTNFSALLILKQKTNDKDEELLSVLKEHYCMNKSCLDFLNNANPKTNKVLYIDGLKKEVSIFDNEKMFLTVTKSKNKMSINVPMWQNKHFEFKSNQENNLSQIILLNNYDEKILFVKDFSFSNGQYRILCNKKKKKKKKN